MLRVISVLFVICGVIFWESTNTSEENVYIPVCYMPGHCCKKGMGVGGGGVGLFLPSGHLSCQSVGDRQPQPIPSGEWDIKTPWRPGSGRMAYGCDVWIAPIIIWFLVLISVPSYMFSHATLFCPCFTGDGFLFLFLIQGRLPVATLDRRQCGQCSMC